MKNISKFFFVIVLFWLGATVYNYLISFFYNNHYETETVFSSLVTNTFSGEMFAFREEELLKLRRRQAKSNLDNKMISYFVKDGEKVAANQVVAVIYNNNKDIKSIYDLASIKEELDLLSEIKLIKNKKSLSSEILYSQIINNLGSFIDLSNKKTLNNLKKEKHDLFISLIKKNLVYGPVKGLDEKIESLKNQEESYSNKKYVFQTIVSPVTGYFTSQLDGFEREILNKNEKNSLLTDNFLDYNSCCKIINSSPSKNNNNYYIGKIITGFDWYIILKTSKKNIDSLKYRNLVEIDCDIANLKKVPAVVLNIEESDNNKDCCVILKSNYISREILGLRKKKVNISTKSFRGLAVSMKAIRFLNGEKGVFIKDDKEIKFKKIDVIFETDQKVLSKLRPLENDYLQAFDEVILSGQGLYDGKIID